MPIIFEVYVYLTWYILTYAKWYCMILWLHGMRLFTLPTKNNNKEKKKEEEKENKIKVKSEKWNDS